MAGKWLCLPARARERANLLGSAIVHSTQEEEEAITMGSTLLGEIQLPLYLRGEEEFFFAATNGCKL